MSGSSTLDPDNFPQPPDRTLGKGHGTDALGPSDNSDSGSDVMGGPGFAHSEEDDPPLDVDTGAIEDRASGHDRAGAGFDMGDAYVESDSDSGGTGERAGAGRDSAVRDGADIDTDTIESIEDVPLTDDDIAFLASSPPTTPRRAH
ncbi:MAG: hypothetical protein H7335_18555 [Massilia sp.]|nr:hypothetical protein [Massilia sp.]